MPLGALALVLLAGVIHASWNIAAKKAGGDVRFAAFTTVILCVAWAPLGLWLAWEVLPSWGMREWGLLAASAFLHSIYYLTLLRGYRKAELTVVYPLARGSGPLLSSLAAVLLLGEQLSALGALGIAGVVGGVFLIAGGPVLWRRSRDPLERVRVRKGVVYGVLTGAFIAGYTVVDGYAVKVLLISPILLDYIGALLRLFLVVPPALRDLEETKRHWLAQWKYALFVGVLSPVSYVLVLYAMRTAPLSHVAPAREVSMLFAALIGGQMLGEKDRGIRVLGAFCIGAGVMALALG
ncbi:EamA family transporter [Ramlibacter sp. G-1-2-2]|uniref:EamA family transporter n=1 Tax=Ramlibacter agri TaxID=2728837 RepID=A0A848H5D6_9BURK|nr:DMT family transporter [Ramlibacter agri]NML43803.1 EamA family transporter [Ramlibacter agri]